MSADLFRDKLVAYLDGQLDTSERSELERHLEACYGCQRELEALRAVLNLTRADVTPRFAGVKWKVPAPRHFPWWRWVWIPAAAAALILMVIFGGDALLKHEVKAQEEWVVVEDDSLSADEGMELAVMLVAEDEELVQGLESYEEAFPADIYGEIDELTEEEEAAFLGLLEEKLQEMERS